MWQRLAKILNRRRSADRVTASVPMSPPRPDTAFFAIGDVHGRLDLLERMLLRTADVDPVAPVICVGDLVDRGPQSADVLALLHARSFQSDPPVMCLRGNHEQMMLDALDDPEGCGPLWLRNGGLQTLASFGIANLSETLRGNDLVDAMRLLRERLAPTHEEWLRSLPLFWTSGNVCAVHAAADPAKPVWGQSADVLLWGHRDFMTDLRQDGQWIVHGHTIVPEAHSANGRIALDTGAYATDILSAAHISEGRVRFLTTADTLL